MDRGRRHWQHAPTTENALLMTHEVAAVRAGSSASTFISPRDLGPLTRRHLRESFRAVALIQGRVDRDWMVRAERMARVR